MSFNIKIQNMVVTASLNTMIKLEKLVANIDNIEYEPNQFPGLVMRINKPKSACLIFNSGKIVCTGTRSLKDAKIVIKRIINKLKSIGIKIPKKKCKIHLENIVASGTLKRELNLDEIGFNMDNTEYEPEQFPGLVFRMYEPKVTFLLFTSGRIICTGAKSTVDVKRAVENLDKRLKKLYKEQIKK